MERNQIKPTEDNIEENTSWQKAKCRINRTSSLEAVNISESTVMYTEPETPGPDV